MTRNGLARQPGALGDYLRIESCVGDLTELQLLLLGESYGPSCFAARPPRRGLSRVRLRGSGRAHPEAAGAVVPPATLKLLRARLRHRRLIISAPAARSANFSQASETWPPSGREREKLER
ncbi:MAG: hypothetical protein ACREQR_00345 [Candidatus Binataceae bacterium]